MSQTRHLLKTMVQSFVVVTLKNYDHGVVCLWHNINLALAVAFTLQNSKIHQFLKINMYAVDLFFAAFLKYHIRFLLRDLRAMLTCELAKNMSSLQYSIRGVPFKTLRLHILSYFSSYQFNSVLFIWRQITTT